MALTRNPRAGAGRCYLQNDIGVHVPSVGGLGQSAFVVQALVQMSTIMTFSHSL
jgi:hypothetical protein